jgi:L-fuculose-phosphate aldolase
MGMLLEAERDLLVAYGRKVLTQRLTVGTGGNLSIFDPSQRLMAITPSGIEYFEIKPEDIVVLRLDGEIVEGDKQPSSELAMHRIVYSQRQDINALIHVHSRYATTLSCMHWDLPAVHYLVALAGKNVRCAPYATFGTEQLAWNALAGMQDRKAVLLANHGLLVGARHLGTAFTITEQIEFCAEIYYRTRSIGEPNNLPDAEIEILTEEFEHYGQK